MSSNNILWLSHHSSQKRGPEVEDSLTCLLPLLHAHSVATIKHSMEKDRDVVKFLNPDQTPLITADQPLFVLANQIQCEWDTEYGEGKYVVMFGGLQKFYYISVFFHRMFDDTNDLRGIVIKQRH